MDSSELIIFDNVINPMNQSTPGIRSGVEPDTIVTSRWFKPDIEDGEFYTIPEGCELSFDNTEWIPEGTYAWPTSEDYGLKMLWTFKDNTVSKVGPDMEFLYPTGTLPDFAGGVRASTIPPIDPAKGWFGGPGYTNKCTCRKANPVDTTNLTKAGDAASVLSVVDYAEALATAGLDNICTSGKVYNLDNSAGTNAAYVIIEGIPGNLNPHTGSIYLAGSGTARFGWQGTAGPEFNNGGWRRH